LGGRFQKIATTPPGLRIALISSVAVVLSSLISRRGANEAARIAAGDQVRFDAAFIQALAELEVAVQDHDAAIEVARIQAAASIEVARLSAHGRRLSASG